MSFETAVIILLIFIVITNLVHTNICSREYREGYKAGYRDGAKGLLTMANETIAQMKKDQPKDS